MFQVGSSMILAVENSLRGKEARIMGEDLVNMR